MNCVHPQGRKCSRDFPIARAQLVATEFAATTVIFGAASYERQLDRIPRLDYNKFTSDEVHSLAAGSDRERAHQALRAAGLLTGLGPNLRQLSD